MACVKRKKKMMMAVALQLLFVFGCGAASLDATDEDAERQVLMEIKKGFNNPPSLDSWNTSRSTSADSRPPPHCKPAWLGVTCTPDDDQNTTFSVTSIVLPTFFHGGSLSPSIATLRNLRELNLSGNAISGSIPPEIAYSLPNLSLLDLSGNNFSGSLPPDWSNLTSLQIASLHLNRLEGSIPPGLFLAPRLKLLRLDGNLLSGEIPPTIVSCTFLAFFSVGNNQLTGPLPYEIGNITSLQSIYAGFNQLNGTLPDSIGDLPQIQHVELQHNNIEGSIPLSWGNLVATLRTLNLSDNQLIGQVPFPLLQNFSISSFDRNPGLCFPEHWNSSSCSNQAAPPRGSPWPPQHQSVTGRNRDGNSRDRRQEDYRRVEIIVGAVVGGILLSLFVCILVYCWGSHCMQRRRQRPADNWFNAETQEGRRQGKFAIFDQAIAKYGYEDFVSHAGFFDTAHVLGKGRFATVYRSDMSDGTQLAVKVFKYPIAGNAFEREMEAMATMKHRHLLGIKAYYCDRVEKAVVYEYLPKGTLYALLHGEDLSSPNSGKGSSKGGSKAATELPDWAMRQRIAYGVAQALDYLHKCGVVHKDVQSRNVLLEAGSMLPRLGDYGMVQVVSNRAMEDVVEKDGYTAPEVIGTKMYSEKSDVYGFGVVLLELVTGKKPVMQVEGEEEGGVSSLASWAVTHYLQGKGREVMDAVAWKTCPFPEYMDTALKLAVSCVSENPALRPPMLEAATVLEGLASNPSPLKTPSDLFSP